MLRLTGLAIAAVIAFLAVAAVVAYAAPFIAVGVIGFFWYQGHKIRSQLMAPRNVTPRRRPR
jgi:hypothetical protein